jgi:hypothetical protein
MLRRGPAFEIDLGLQDGRASEHRPALKFETVKEAFVHRTAGFTPPSGNAFTGNSPKPASLGHRTKTQGRSRAF